MLFQSRKSINTLGDRIRIHPENLADRELLNGYRSFRSTNIADLFEIITRPSLEYHNALSCRIKRFEAIIRKLKREQHTQLVRMDDVIGFRFVVGSPKKQVILYEQLRKALNIYREKDYTISPPPTGYRAIHLSIKHENKVPSSDSICEYPCEIQIRTYYQHLWATMSESFGEQVKEGGGTNEQKEYLTKLSNIIMDYEIKNFDSNQQEILDSGIESAYYIINFDKKHGDILTFDSYGQNLKSAITNYIYLENLTKDSLSKEVVLLCGPKDRNIIKITHMRYFMHRGIPIIPTQIMPAGARPN